MPTKDTPARTFFLEFKLQKTKLQMGVQVLLSNPRVLAKISQRYLHFSVLQFIFTPFFISETYQYPFCLSFLG
jgi:hypothetical protein